MTRPNLTIIAAVMINVFAVAAQTPTVRTSWPIREAPAEWRSTISRADVLIVSMQDSLLRQLTFEEQPLLLESPLKESDILDWQRTGRDLRALEVLIEEAVPAYKAWAYGPAVAPWIAGVIFGAIAVVPFVTAYSVLFDRVVDVRARRTRSPSDP